MKFVNLSMIVKLLCLTFPIFILQACNGGSGGGGSQSQTSSQQYAYFVNSQADNYTQCSITNNIIDSSTCQTHTPTGSGALNFPIRLVINDGFAYFINYHSNSYTQCAVNNTGIILSTCNTVLLGDNGILNNPSGIEISNGTIYFTNNGNKDRSKKS